MEKRKVVASDIEIAVAKHFCFRRNLIVPNVSWGLDLIYEADLVVVRPSGFALEIEIKVSASDIKADLKKKKWFKWGVGKVWPSDVFKEFWFAVPWELRDNENIPDIAGIIAVKKDYAQVIRRGPVNPRAEKLGAKQVDCLRSLAAMRIWSLKEKLAACRFRIEATRGLLKYN